MWSPVQNGWVSKSTGLMGCRRLSHHGQGILDPRCSPGHKWHGGLDVGSSRGEGTPVYAVDAGRIFYASNVNGSQGYGGYGKVVVLKVGAEYVLYAHLKDVLVSTGDRVDAGKVLGTMGRTRGSVSNPGEMFRHSGTHLHFEVSSRRYPKEYGRGNVDPLEWLAYGGTRISEGSTGFRIRHSEENMSRQDLRDEAAPIPEPVDGRDHWYLESVRLGIRNQAQLIRRIDQRLAAVSDDRESARFLGYFRASQAITIMEYGWISGILLSPDLSGQTKAEAIRLMNLSIQGRVNFYNSIMRGDSIAAITTAFSTVTRQSIAFYDFFRGLRRDVVLPAIGRGIGAVADTMGEQMVETVKDLLAMTPDLFPGTPGFKWGRLVFFSALAAGAFAYTKYKLATVGRSSAPAPLRLIPASNPKRGKRPSARRLVK